MAIISEIKDPFQLSHLFSQIGTEKEGQRGVLVKDGNGYQVVHLDKRSCHFMTYNEMVGLVGGMMGQLVENPVRAKKISRELEVMTARKIERESHQNVLIRIILKIIQRVKNFFKGRGFLTNVGYANQLFKKLDNLSTPQPEIFEPRPPVRQREETARQTIRRQSTVGKTAAVEAFKRDPVNCSVFHRTILFRDIDSYERLSQLVHDITGLQSLDFNNPWCRTIALEALKFVVKETSDTIITQLAQRPEFTPAFFREVLNLIIEKANDQKAFSLYSLELLIKTYMERNWHQGDLPLDDATLLNGVQLLIKSKPNENPTTQFIDWMMNTPAFNFDVCVACITSYLEKKWEKPPQEQLTIVYPNLQVLEAHFREKQWAAHADSVDHQDVKRHLLTLR